MTIEKSKDPSAFYEFEKRGWEANSSGYDRHFSSVTEQVVEPLLDAARVRSNMRVLDLCCGPGLLAGRAATRGATVVGLDFAEHAIDAAKRNHPDVEFVQGDAEGLNFEDASFDAVVCGYGIIHLPNPANALLEVRRVLQPGGRAAFSVWESPGPNNGFGLLLGAIKAHGDLNVPLPHGPDLFQFSEPARFKAALREVGFSDIDVVKASQTWLVASSGDMISALIEGTVRTQALYLAQTDTARISIEAALADDISRFPRVREGFAVPMPAIIGSGTA